MDNMISNLGEASFVVTCQHQFSQALKKGVAPKNVVLNTHDISISLLQSDISEYIIKFLRGRLITIVGYDHTFNSPLIKLTIEGNKRFSALVNLRNSSLLAPDLVELLTLARTQVYSKDLTNERREMRQLIKDGEIKVKVF